MSKKSDAIVATIVRLRWPILIGTFLLTCFFGFFLTKIEVNNDPTKAIPPDLEELIAYNNLQKVFNSPRSILFLAEFDSLPLRTKIDSVSSWAAQFNEIDGIENCVHLGTIHVPVSGGLFGLSSARIVPKSKDTSEDSLRSRIAANPEFTSAFISKDESVLGMIMEIDDSKNQVRIVTQVVDLQTKLNEIAPAKIVITGAPLYAYSIDKSMRRDFSLLLPICLAVVFVMLLWVFRRMLYVMSSLATITVAIIWTFGLMGITGHEFSVVTAIIPVILFPIGVASAIHVFKTYSRKQGGSGKTGIVVIQETFKELLNPIFLSALTTFVGFASFAVSRITWTKTFGIFTSIGVALALLLSIILLPIVLSFDTRHSASSEDKERDKVLSSFWKWYRAFVESKYQWLVLIAAILVIGVVGFLRVRVEGNPIAMFPPKSDIRKSDEIIAEHLGGTRFLWIVLEHKKDEILSVEQWQQVQEIAQYAEKQEMVGGSTSLLPLINRVSTMLTDESISNAGLRMVLGSKGLLGKRFGKYIATWITEDRRKTKIALICKNATGGTRFLDLSKQLQNHITENYPDWESLVVGPPVLNDAMTNVLVVTQKTSLAFAFISVFLVLCIIFRSVKVGLFAIMPIVLSTLFVYAMMGFFGVAINTVTVIIVNTCIGIGIDYAIHFVAGYLYALPTHKNRFDALMATAEVKGTVIMFNTLIVGIGFLVLAFSSFPPIRAFGLFVFVSMVSSSVFALVFLPVFFRLFGSDAHMVHLD